MSATPNPDQVQPIIVDLIGFSEEQFQTVRNFVEQVLPQLLERFPRLACRVILNRVTTE